MPEIIKNEVNFSQCVCLNCPSYNECARDKSEKLYCATEVGASDCKYHKNGCICASCPVHKNNSLNNGYYCLAGSASKIG